MSTKQQQKATPAQASSGKGGQGTATKERKPRLTLEARIAVALSTYGKSDAALKAIGPAWQAAEQASAAVVEWVAIAQQWQKAGKSGREWGRQCGGSAMTFGRLLDTGTLIAASRKGEGTRTLTPREAVKVVNVSTREHVATLAAEMLAGRDPLGTKGTDPGSHAPSKGKGTRKAQPGNFTLAPADYVRALEIMIANVSRIQKGDTAVMIATLAGDLQKAATSQAATLATPKGRKPGATPAVMAS